MNAKRQGIFFLLGVFFFAVSIFQAEDVTVQISTLEFNPYLGLGVVMFGIGSARPFYGLISKKL
jgi:hypothetical protein